MPRWVFAVAVFAGLALADRAVAQSVVKPGGAPAPGACHRCPAPRLCGCPDDYCRKPWPHIWCVPCGEPYCYCGKPSPCIWLLSCCGPDDYCRKPCPQVCRPLCQDYYTCGRPCLNGVVVVTPVTDTKTVVNESAKVVPAGRR